MSTLDISLRHPFIGIMLAFHYGPQIIAQFFAILYWKVAVLFDGLWLLVQDSAALFQHNDMDNTPTDHQEAEYLLTSNVLVELSSCEKWLVASGEWLVTAPISNVMYTSIQRIMTIFQIIIVYWVAAVFTQVD